MAAPRFRAAQLHRNGEWFYGLQSSEIDLILGAARSCRFPAKSIMTFQGDPADHFLLMWEGRARYFFEAANGKKVILMWIRQGDVFGATTLVPKPSFYLSSTEAVMDSTVLVWDRSTMRALAQRFPKLLENVLVIATNYFYWYVAAHAALVSQTARERLAHVIFGLTESIGEKANGFVEIDVTNEELASSANITIYTVSRMISSWEREGVIRRKRGKILVRSPEGLFGRAAKHAAPNRQLRALNP
jgi:CRP/FNR family transcriptional regulator, nitrogen oxide reductase regulator